MTTRHWLPGLFLVLMSTAIGDDEPVGACTYVQETSSAGPFDICEAPLTETVCTELNQTDDYRDASFAEGGECDTKREIVGICDLGDSQMYYYSGNAFGLEIGCGNHGAKWIATDGEETIAEQFKRRHEESKARTAAINAARKAEEAAEAARRSAEVLEFEDKVQIHPNTLLSFRAYGVQGYGYAAQFERCWNSVNDESGKLITDIIQKTKSGLEKEGIQWFRNPRVLVIEYDVFEFVGHEANVFFSFGDKPDNYLRADFKFVYSAEMRKDVPEYTQSCTYEYKGYGLVRISSMRRFINE